MKIPGISYVALSCFFLAGSCAPLRKEATAKNGLPAESFKVPSRSQCSIIPVTEGTDFIRSLQEVLFYEFKRDIFDRVRINPRSQAHMDYLGKAAVRLDGGLKPLARRYLEKHAGFLALLGDEFIRRRISAPGITAEQALELLPSVFPQIVQETRQYEDVSDLRQEELLALYSAIMPAYKEEFKRISPYAITEARQLQAAMSRVDPLAGIRKFGNLGIAFDKGYVMLLESRLIGATGLEYNNLLIQTAQHPTVFESSAPERSLPIPTITHEMGHAYFQEVILEPDSTGPHPSGKAYRADYLTGAEKVEDVPRFIEQMRENGATYLSVPGLSYEENLVEAFSRFVSIKMGFRQLSDYPKPLYTDFERQLLLKALSDYDWQHQNFLEFAKRVASQ